MWFRSLEYEKTVRVVTEPEYRAWAAEQKSYYEQFVKKADEAPEAVAEKADAAAELLSDKK
jgi:heme/copper-type cytochrome/quinol oxidase subunit 2